ncbi:MAG: hypothetical protein KL863_05280 [Rhizobium sp.]|nr:hypothetical protein [Rhizobium sp.]
MSDLKAMNHDDFRAYLLDRYASLFPPDFEASKAKSFAYQYLPECESGWHPLIDEALQRIDDFLQKEGWLGKAFVRQVKEKFGGLRIYVRPDGDTDWPDHVAEGVGKIRMEIEDRSAHICEICGERGEIVVIDSYHQCLCPEHHKRRLNWVEAGRPDVDWR